MVGQDELKGRRVVVIPSGDGAHCGDMQTAGGVEAADCALDVPGGEQAVCLIDDESGAITVVQPNEDGSYWRKIVRNKIVRMKEKRRAEAAAKLVSDTTRAALAKETLAPRIPAFRKREEEEKRATSCFVLVCQRTGGRPLRRTPRRQPRKAQGLQLLGPLHADLRHRHDHGHSRDHLRARALESYGSDSSLSPPAAHTARARPNSVAPAPWELPWA